MIERMGKSGIVLKGIVGLGLVFSCLLPAAQAALDEASVDDFSDAPGLNWLDGERYDPFTGVMKYRLTDFKIPGNGTLDLVVVRDTRNILTPTLSNVWNYSRYELYNIQPDGGTTRFRVKENTFECLAPSTDGPSVDNKIKVPQENGQGEVVGYTYEARPSDKNIVLDLYGKKIHFYSKDNPAFTKGAHFPSDAQFISSDNWYISCDASVGLTAHSPAGVKWVFGAAQAYSSQSMPLTQIKDRFGNSISYNYERLSPYGVTAGAAGHAVSSNSIDSIEGAFYKTYISNIVASDSRRVDFLYNSSKQLYQYHDNSTDSNSKQRVRKIDVNGGCVEREDGKRWVYSYETPFSGAGSQLKSITNPEGLKVTYDYVRGEKMPTWEGSVAPIRCTPRQIAPMLF